MEMLRSPGMAWALAQAGAGAWALDLAGLGAGDLGLAVADLLVVVGLGPNLVILAGAEAGAQGLG